MRGKVIPAAFDFDARELGDDELAEAAMRGIGMVSSRTGWDMGRRKRAQTMMSTKGGYKGARLKWSVDNQSF